MLTRFEPLAFAALRVVGGFLFMAHGLQKFGLLGDDGMVNLVSRLGAAAFLETIGGPLIILGWFTVPTAVVLAGEMAVAYFTVHNPSGFWPIENGGELAAFYCFFFLLVATRGPGLWSLDRRRRRPTG
jgi:putative oxidoreductase